MWLLIGLPIEFLISFKLFNLYKTSEIKNILITGNSNIKTLPIDNQLLKLTTKPTWLQTKLTNSFCKITRYVINTKAYELAIMLFIQKNWPNKITLDNEVKIIL